MAFRLSSSRSAQASPASQQLREFGSRLTSPMAANSFSSRKGVSSSTPAEKKTNPSVISSVLSSSGSGFTAIVVCKSSPVPEIAPHDAGLGPWITSILRNRTSSCVVELVDFHNRSTVSAKSSGIGLLKVTIHLGITNRPLRCVISTSDQSSSGFRIVKNNWNLEGKSKECVCFLKEAVLSKYLCFLFYDSIDSSREHHVYGLSVVQATREEAEASQPAPVEQVLSLSNISSQRNLQPGSPGSSLEEASSSPSSPAISAVPSHPARSTSTPRTRVVSQAFPSSPPSPSSVSSFNNRSSSAGRTRRPVAPAPSSLASGSLSSRSHLRVPSTFMGSSASSVSSLGSNPYGRFVPESPSVYAPRENMGLDVELSELSSPVDSKQAQNNRMMGSAELLMRAEQLIAESEVDASTFPQMASLSSSAQSSSSSSSSSVSKTMYDPFLQQYVTTTRNISPRRQQPQQPEPAQPQTVSVYQMALSSASNNSRIASSFSPPRRFISPSKASAAAGPDRMTFEKTLQKQLISNGSFTAANHIPLDPRPSYTPSISEVNLALLAGRRRQSSSSSSSGASVALPSTYSFLASSASSSLSAQSGNNIPVSSVSEQRSYSTAPGVAVDLDSSRRSRSPSRIPSVFGDLYSKTPSFDALYADEISRLQQQFPVSRPLSQDQLSSSVSVDVESIPPPSRLAPVPQSMPVYATPSSVLPSPLAQLKPADRFDGIVEIDDESIVPVQAQSPSQPQSTPPAEDQDKLRRNLDLFYKSKPVRTAPWASMRSTPAPVVVDLDSLSPSQPQAAISQPLLQAIAQPLAQSAQLAAQAPQAQLPTAAPSQSVVPKLPTQPPMQAAASSSSVSSPRISSADILAIVGPAPVPVPVSTPALSFGPSSASPSAPVPSPVAAAAAASSPAVLPISKQVPSSSAPASSVPAPSRPAPIAPLSGASPAAPSPSTSPVNASVQAAPAPAVPAAPSSSVPSISIPSASPSPSAAVASAPVVVEPVSLSSAVQSVVAAPIVLSPVPAASEAAPIAVVPVVPSDSSNVVQDAPISPQDAPAAPVAPVSLRKQDKDLSVEELRAKYTVDQQAALQFLEAGTVFYKHHFHSKSKAVLRKVWFDSHSKAIVWGKQNARKNDFSGAIKVEDFRYAVFGNKTSAMRMRKVQTPWRCLSIVTRDRTLDLEATSDELADGWILALQSIFFDQILESGRRMFTRVGLRFVRLRMKLEAQAGYQKKDWTSIIKEALNKTASYEDGAVNGADSSNNNALPPAASPAENAAVPLASNSMNDSSSSSVPSYSNPSLPEASIASAYGNPPLPSGGNPPLPQAPPPVAYAYAASTSAYGANSS